MSCTRAVFISPVKKFLFVLLICLTTTQQAQASKGPFYLLLAGTAVLTLTGLGVTYHSYHGEPIEDSMRLMPKIIYHKDQSDKGGSAQIVLKPRIVRGDYIKPGIWDNNLNNFIKNSICNPITQSRSADVDLHAINLLCNNWFEKHTMTFPHQALGISIDDLDTLLLPTLVYDINQGTLDMQASHIAFVDSNDEPSGATSSATSKKNKKWILAGISFPELDSLTDMRQHPLELCHHSPEWARMQEPRFNSTGVPYYNFPVPGISHLHRSDQEYYIVTLGSRQKPKGYYWVIGASWPDGYRSLTLTKPKSKLSSSFRHL